MVLHVLKYHVGQIINHKKFGYRGVIFDVDARFSASHEWYETVAKSRPPKDAPWYHVLVDGTDSTTYVAERHIQSAEDLSEIDHPMVDIYFEGFFNDHYSISMKQ